MNNLPFLVRGRIFMAYLVCVCVCKWWTNYCGNVGEVPYSWVSMVQENTIHIAT